MLSQVCNAFPAILHILSPLLTPAYRKVVLITCTGILFYCYAQWLTPIIIMQIVLETQKRLGLLSSQGIWALILQSLNSPDVSGKLWTALSPAVSEARKGTHCISQPPWSCHWERSQEGGGTFRDRIIILRHLVKQRGGQGTWGRSKELSSIRTWVERATVEEEVWHQGS